MKRAWSILNRSLDAELGVRDDRRATEDALLLCRSEHVDVVVDATGSVEFGAHVALEAFRHGKDVVLMNAEIDATIGPILQLYARQSRRHSFCLRRRRTRRANEPRIAGSRDWG